MNEVLERWNGLDAASATAEVVPCCGSLAWARGMADRRPIGSEAELLAAGDAVWGRLCEADWMEAFASHPRIGERHATGEATAQSLAWSGREQGGLALDRAETAQRLAEGNRDYEAKFGRTFLIFANGKSGEEILAVLKRRLENDAAGEMREAAEQQRQIAALRLRRWIGAA